MLYVAYFSPNCDPLTHVGYLIEGLMIKLGEFDLDESSYFHKDVEPEILEIAQKETYSRFISKLLENEIKIESIIPKPVYGITSCHIVYVDSFDDYKKAILKQLKEDVSNSENKDNYKNAYKEIKNQMTPQRVAAILQKYNVINTAPPMFFNSAYEYVQYIFSNK